MLTYSDLQISPAQVQRLEEITVTVLVSAPAINGGHEVTEEVKLTGWWRLSQWVTLITGESRVVTFKFRPSSTCTAGVHSIIVGDLSGTVEVLDGEPDTPPPVDGTISITTSPVGAEIMVDGQPVGSTQPSQGVTVEAAEGQHTVSFGYVEGYETPADVAVTVAADSDTPVWAVYVPTGALPDKPKQAWLPWVLVGVVVAAVVVSMKKKDKV